MAVTEIVSTVKQIASVLDQVRRYRHQPECRCCAYQTYCNTNEATWSSILDRLIDRARDEQSNPTPGDLRKVSDKTGEHGRITDASKHA